MQVTKRMYERYKGERLCIGKRTADKGIKSKSKRKMESETEAKKEKSQRKK